MTATEVTEHAAFLTEAQRACRIAKETGREIDMQKAAAMLDSSRMSELPAEAQEDLYHAYAAAVCAMGALV
jgi:hypothetical protein